MRVLLPLPLLVLLVVAYPYGVNKTVITVDDYPEHLIIYEGKYDIVDIMVPLNALNEYDDYEHHNLGPSRDKRDHVIFFVEADIKPNHRKYRGIYMYIHGKATKLMDKGRAIAASYDDSSDVFLGGKDGLYLYNPDTQKAEKYGKFNTSVKDLAKEQYTDVIYILTDDRELYKVYDAGTKKEKFDDIIDADQIMMDYSNNLYYYGIDKIPYVRTADGKTKRIEGLPEGAKEVKFLRPLLFNNDEIELMIDNKIYTIFSDGTSQSENLEFTPEAKPTAYSMEAGIFHYFGYKKKIYGYELSLIKDYEFTGFPGLEFDSKSESKED